MRTRPTHRPRVAINDVAAQCGVTTAQFDGHVSGIALNTAQVETGDLYAALPGASAHGASYAAQALARGAVAIVTDAEGAALIATEIDMPILVVDNPRALLPRLSRFIYGAPSADLTMVGITGTQGKTTTTYLAESALVGAGLKPAVIGTIGTRINGRPAESSLTTPEAPQLQSLLAVMREEHIDVCAMEVSSHAMVKGRVDGVVFDTAVFLNLGRDHLDFHHDIEDYFQAKASLFTPEHARRAVVNIDDAHGRRLIEQTTLPVTTFSTDGNRADWQAVNIRPHRLGTDLSVLDPQNREHALRVPLPGLFNVSNALAVLAMLVDDKRPVSLLAQGIAACTGVPGRMERVEAGQDFTAVVDYAHKPDAVEAVLNALRPVTAGRLIMVLGAGGDRDAGKRSVMGDTAARLADIVIITDDNPRTEDPAAIRNAILEGAQGSVATVIDMPGRRAAIAAAVQTARTGDTVVVAGRGHERGQDINGRVLPFDDRVELETVLRATLQQRGDGANS